jgi:hypothetical protein
MGALSESIKQKYTVHGGVIVNPGKFEGEPTFVAHYYDEALDGREDDWFMDEDDTHVSVYFPTDVEKAEFPDLKDVACVYVWERSDGFVQHTSFTDLPENRIPRSRQ